MKELRDHVEALIANLKTVEASGPKFPEHDLKSTHWRKISCMLDGDYKPSVKDKFDWFRGSCGVLEIAAVAIEGFKMYPKEEIDESAEMCNDWYNLYDAAYQLSDTLIQSLER